MHISGSSSSRGHDQLIQGEGWGENPRSIGGFHASPLLGWAGIMAACNIMGGLAVVSVL